MKAYFFNLAALVSILTATPLFAWPLPKIDKIPSATGKPQPFQIEFPCEINFRQFKSALEKAAACEEAGRWGIKRGAAFQVAQVAGGLEHLGAAEIWEKETRELEEKYAAALAICNDFPGVKESNWSTGASTPTMLAIAQLKLTKFVTTSLRDTEHKVCNACEGTWPDETTGHPCEGNTPSLDLPPPSSTPSPAGGGLR